MLVTTPPTFNIVERTFLVRAVGAESIGTAFGVTWNGRHLLFTARHVFDGFRVDQLEVLKGEHWELLSGSPIAFPYELDILAIEVPNPIWLDFDILIGGDFHLGEDVYILGFPLRLFHTAENLGIEYAMPFVAKGVVAAVATRKSAAAKAIFLSALLDIGFSGGPVVSGRAVNGRHRVLGFVTKSVRFRDEVAYENGTKILVRHSANLVECCPIFEVVKTLGPIPKNLDPASQ